MSARQKWPADGPQPVPLFDTTGHHPPVDTAVAILPESPATMPRDAYRVWCAIRAYGPLYHGCRCGMRCNSRTCSIERVLSIEHDMEAIDISKAIALAVAHGWVRQRDSQGKYEHVSKQERTS